MSKFASPFFQTILSVEKHCIPLPPITTYETDFQDPKLKKERERQKQPDLHDDHISDEGLPAGLRYCKNKPQNYKGQQANLKRRCPKRITTYMIDFQNPHDRFNLLRLRSNSQCENLAQVHLDNGNELPKSEEEKQYLAKDKTSEENVGIVNANKDELKMPKVFKKTEQKPPQWKVEGWKTIKKLCDPKKLY